MKTQVTSLFNERHLRDVSVSLMSYMSFNLLVENEDDLSHDCLMS